MIGTWDLGTQLMNSSGSWPDNLQKFKFASSVSGFPGYKKKLFFSHIYHEVYVLTFEDIRRNELVTKIHVTSTFVKGVNKFLG